MLKLKRILVFLIVLVLLLGIGIQVNATNTTLDLDDFLNSNSLNTTTNTLNTVTNTTINTTINTTTNTIVQPDTNKTESGNNLPQTGVTEDITVMFFIIVCVIVSIYAYKKIRDYKA